MKSSPSAADTASPPPCPPCGARGRPHRRRHRRRRRRIHRTSARPARVLPPGDLRMALAARRGPRVRDALGRCPAHRFDGDESLAGHPVGNLVLAACSNILATPWTASTSPAAPRCARPRPAHGRRPSTSRRTSTDVCPRRRTLIRGQLNVASVDGRRQRPARPRRPAGMPRDPRGGRRRGLARLRPGLVVHLRHAHPARARPARRPRRLQRPSRRRAEPLQSRRARPTDLTLGSPRALSAVAPNLGLNVVSATPTLRRPEDP